ncbi:MAG: surface lipoprotein assembly modifier [Pseudomonadota bacterium]
MTCLALWILPSAGYGQTLRNVQEALAAGRPDIAVATLNEIEPETEEDRRQYLFLYGLAAIELGEYDVAISALERLVTATPGLPRPRLELARAYFLNGNDGNARQQFLLVLGGDLPPEVVANVQIFLDQIEARRDWYFSVTGGVAPDTNVNAASTSRTVRFGGFDEGIEFTRSDDSVANSGFGLELISRAGKFFPYGDRRNRFFVKGEVISRDYANITFDDLQGTVQIGHGWQWQSAVLNIGPIHGRRWFAADPYSQTQGLRIDGAVRTAPRWTWNAFVEVAEDTLIDRRLDDDRQQTVDRIYVSAGPTYSLSPKTRVGLSLGALANDGDNDDDDKSGMFVGLRFYTEFENGLTVSLAPRITGERFHAERPIVAANERRSDITYSFTTEISHRQFRINGLQPYVQLSLSKRESVSEFYEYERARVFAGLTRQF